MVVLGGPGKLHGRPLDGEKSKDFVSIFTSQSTAPVTAPHVASTAPSVPVPRVAAPASVSVGSSVSGPSTIPSPAYFPYVSFI